MGSYATINPKRKEMPIFSNVMKGNRSTASTKMLLAEKWHDKKDVHMLSPVHAHRMVEVKRLNYNGEVIVKPESVLDYTKTCVLVTSLIGFYFTMTARKTVKWYKKLFFFSNIGHVPTKCICIVLNEKGKKPKFPNFKLTVVRQLLEEFATERMVAKARRKHKQGHKADAIYVYVLANANKRDVTLHVNIKTTALSCVCIRVLNNKILNSCFGIYKIGFGNIQVKS